MYVNRCVQDPSISAELMDKISIDVKFPDISEDCLYLNIYTPSESGKLPVSIELNTRQTHIYI